MDTRKGPLDNTRLVSHHPLISRVYSAGKKGTTTGYPIYLPLHKSFKNFWCIQPMIKGLKVVLFGISPPCHVLLGSPGAR